MTTKNNSQNLIEIVGGIDKARGIVNVAPEGAELFNKFYIRNVHSEGYIDHFAKWNGCKWQQAEAHREFVNEAISLNDLRTAIAEHDSREFKVGDWIIDSLVGNKVIRYHEGYAYLNEHYVKAFLKHATPEEIKAGHRLEAERHG